MRLALLALAALLLLAPAAAAHGAGTQVVCDVDCKVRAIEACAAGPDACAAGGVRHVEDCVLAGPCLHAA